MIATALGSFGMLLVLCFGATFLATVVFTMRLRRWLIKRAILDIPNARSSHEVPVPRGGGLAMVGAVTLVWLWAVMVDLVAPATLLALALGLGLATISWLDDQRQGGLTARVRLGAQALAVCIGVATLPADGYVFGGFLPWWLDRVVTVIGWIWFLNLFNFMDGIDGLAGCEVMGVGLGLALLGLIWFGVPPEFATIPLILTGAAAGFLVWNWYPAKIFMGDVGSITLGFWLAWLLVHAAMNGALAVAIILPLYFLFDATYTLIWRLTRGEKIWQAHRSHFYQVAARGYGRHDKVVWRVLLLNATLVALALAWMVDGLSGEEIVGLAALATASVMLAFARVGKNAKGIKP